MGSSPRTSRYPRAPGAFLTAVMCGLGAFGLRADGPAAPAVPLDAVSGVIAAFRSHSVVALGDGANHGDEESHAFRLSLLRDPRFAGSVDDILVEWGNSRHQGLIDRFVSGDDIAADVLRHVWQDTTEAGPIWDAPIYEAFFRAVREVNLAAPPRRRIRVLLGGPPIDWDDVRTARDIHQWAGHGRALAIDLVRREVLAKRRRVLIVYGAGHLWRTMPTGPGQSQADVASIVGALEAGDQGTRVFSIATPDASVDWRRLQPDVDSWPAPTLTRLRGTRLGAAPFRLYVPVPSAFRDRDPLRHLRMEDQFDALLYLGRSAVRASKLAPTLCTDLAYMEMRLRRMALVASIMPTGGQDAIDRLKRDCATVAPR